MKSTFSHPLFSMRRSVQRGISTITLMIGVVLGGLMLLGGIAMFGTLSQQKATNDAQDVAQLVTSVKSYGASRNGNFSGVTTQLAASLNWFPSTSGTGTATTAALGSGTNVTVSSVNVVNTNDGVGFTLTGYPSAQCTELVQKVERMVNTISVGGTSVKANGAALQVQTAANQCIAGADNVTIVIGVRG